MKLKQVTKMERILVVDDEVNVRNIISWALAEAGYQTAFAENGDAAIRLLKANPEAYDFVVTDIQMPILTGIDLLEFTVTMPNPPMVILISAHVDLDYFDAIEKGAVALVAKPFSAGVLITAIREAAHKKRTQQSKLA